MTRRSFFLLSGFVLALLAADGRSNLTGTWKLNLERSQLANGKPIPYYKEAVLTLDHKDPAVSWREEITSGTGRKRSTRSEFRIGADESEFIAQPEGGNPVKATIRAFWDGDTLVTELTSPTYRITRRIRMGSGGKSLEADWTLNQKSGTVTAKEVWEKQ